MARVSLKGVFRVRSKGRWYYYAWKGRGAPRLLSPPGSPEFVQELADALASRKIGQRTEMSGLVIDYRASDEFHGLAESTKAQWRPWLDRIADHFGPLSLSQFERPQIKVDVRRWRDGWKSSPRSADFAIQVLSRVLSFGISEGRLSLNQCTGIPKLYQADRSDRVWTEADLDKLYAAASPAVAQAAKLALLTGFRRGDLLRLSWSHVSDHFIEIRTSKSRRRTVAIVPMYGELAELLAEIPRRASTILTTSAGKPWGSGFSSSWTKAIKDAGLSHANLHFHDLRGAAATKLYAAGLSEAEIAQTLGWEEQRVSRMIERYVKKDDVMRERATRLNTALAGRGAG